MAFEEGINMAWVIVLSLAVIIIMIGFFLFFRPSVAGGLLSNLVSALKFLTQPVV